jgi:hypothetical protein
LESDVIDERLVLRVEDLPLPGERLIIFAISGDPAVPGSTMAVRSASPFGNGARRALGEKLVDLGPGHLQEFGYVVCH